MPKQYLLAHRGYSAIAPENTKLAFDCAYLFGFDGVEIDVHLSKDQKLVVIHDETTTRTTLNSLKIQNSMLNDLKKENYAAFFKIKTPKQSILTLDEFLSLYYDKFQFINIEIKTDVIAYPNIEKLIHEKVKNLPDVDKKIIFSSFNFNSLVNMYQYNAKYQLGFLWWKKRHFNRINQKELKKICKYLHPWIRIYETCKDEYRILNMPFVLWTTYSENKYQQFLKDDNVLMQISNYKY